MEQNTDKIIPNDQVETRKNRRKTIPKKRDGNFEGPNFDTRRRRMSTTATSFSKCVNKLISKDKLPSNDMPKIIANSTRVHPNSSESLELQISNVTPEINTIDDNNSTNKKDNLNFNLNEESKVNNNKDFQFISNINPIVELPEVDKFLKTPFKKISKNIETDNIISDENILRSNENFTLITSTPLDKGKNKVSSEILIRELQSLNETSRPVVKDSDKKSDPVDAENNFGTNQDRCSSMKIIFDERIFGDKSEKIDLEKKAKEPCPQKTTTPPKRYNTRSADVKTGEGDFDEESDSDGDESSLEMVLETDQFSDAEEKNKLQIETTPTKSKKRKALDSATSPRKERKKTTVSDLEKMPEVIELMQSGIDEMWEEKAERTKLTSFHVKNIIKNVMTDENVLAMVRNTIMESEDANVIFEPKTRAKKKELLEKHRTELGVEIDADASTGQWPVVQWETSDTQQLFTKEFPEDDDDEEEYHPEENSEDESFLSGNAGSDIGSPSTPTLVQKCSVSSVTPSSNPSLPNSASKTDFKSPRAETMLSKSLLSQKSVQRTLSFEEPKEELICQRTRSKKSFTDTPLEQLEMALQPPDITKDMYEMECEDVDYKNFLIEFINPLVPNTTETVEDDDAADPEYNYLEDFEFLEKDEYDEEDKKEEMRGDRAVQISKKEYAQMINDLLDSFDVPDSKPDDKKKEAIEEINQNLNGDRTEINREPASTDSSGRSLGEESEKEAENAIYVEVMTADFSTKQLEILSCQMLQHVQLLATSVLMCNKNELFSHVSSGLYGLLKELMLSAKSSFAFGNKSYFKPENLEPALELLDKFNELPPIDYSSTKAFPTSKPVNKFSLELLKGITDIMFESSAFPYISLLPTCMFRLTEKKSSKNFTDSEDLLLASGLQEHLKFKYKPEGPKALWKRDKEALVKATETKLAGKKMDVVFTHFKNLKRLAKFRKSQMNPIMDVYLNGNLNFPSAVPEVLNFKIPCPLHLIPLNNFKFPWKNLVAEWLVTRQTREAALKTRLVPANNARGIKNLLIVQTKDGNARLIVPQMSSNSLMIPSLNAVKLGNELPLPVSFAQNVSVNSNIPITPQTSQTSVSNDNSLIKNSTHELINDSHSAENSILIDKMSKIESPSKTANSNVCTISSNILPSPEKIEPIDTSSNNSSSNLFVEKSTSSSIEGLKETETLNKEIPVDKNERAEPQENASSENVPPISRTDGSFYGMPSLLETPFKNLSQNEQEVTPLNTPILSLSSELSTPSLNTPLKEETRSIFVPKLSFNNDDANTEITINTIDSKSKSLEVFPTSENNIETNVVPKKDKDECDTFITTIYRSPIATATVVDEPKRSRLLSVRPSSKSPVKTSPLKKVSPILRKYRKYKKNKAPKIAKILPKIQITKLNSEKKRQRTIASKSSLKPTKILPKVTTNARSHSMLNWKISDNIDDNDLQLAPLEDHLKDNSTIRERATNPAGLEEPQNSDADDEECEDDRDKYETEDVDDEEEEEEEFIDEEHVQENEEHLEALLKASSTITCKRSGERKISSKTLNKTCNKTLNKQQKRLQAQIIELSHNYDCDSQDRLFAQQYLIKVRNAVCDDDKFMNFITILNDFNSSSSPIQLYFDVCEMLKDYPLLVTEFLQFLQPHQAIKVGKFEEYSTLRNMRVFLEKLLHKFSKQPQHGQKIMKTLQNLQESDKLDKESFKSAMTPLLKYPDLMESLTKCFPCFFQSESHPSDFEEINLDEPGSPDGAEHLAWPDDDLRSSPDTCECPCHKKSVNVPNNSVSNGFQVIKDDVCTLCGVRFIDGKVYLKCGKGLRPARVIYSSNNNENLKKINNNFDDNLQMDLFEVTSINSKTKNVLKATKENEDRVNLINEISKKTINNNNDNRKNICEKVASSQTIKEQTPANNTDISMKDNTSSVSNSHSKESPNESVPLIGEFHDSKLTINTNVEKLKIEHEPLFWDRDEIEKDDAIEDSTDVVDRDVADSSCTDAWTKDEDMTLLLAVQDKPVIKELFEELSIKLKKKSSLDVKNRFNYLMKLMMEEANCTEMMNCSEDDGMIDNL